MSKIRVLIVEDSAVIRLLLEQIVAGDSRLEVAASVSTAEEALRILPSVHPDVISMDINLPGIDGLEATHRVMAEHPTPIVIVSSTISPLDAQTSIAALRAGALAVMEKPVGPGDARYEPLARELQSKLRLMSEVSVVRQRAGRQWRMPENAAVPPEATPTNRSSSASRRDALAAATRSVPLRYLGVVTSTGGPQALVRLFNDLGADFPLPILLIQHITPAFIESFATWLDSIVPFRTVIAADGDRPLPGHLYLPPADRHLLLATSGAGDLALRLSTGPLVSGQRPSGTMLFSSMAIAAGTSSVGALLTGMGDDGADGLGALRRAGGYTIAEDASTAIVYGMPAAAAERGAAIDVLPLPAIGPRIRECVRAHAFSSATVASASDSESGRMGS